MAVVKVKLRSDVKCLINLKSLSTYLYVDAKITTLSIILYHVFFEDVTKWIDEGSPVDTIYLDFKKPTTKCHIKDYCLNYRSMA